jgi:hypothetical protein
LALRGFWAGPRRKGRKAKRGKITQYFVLRKASRPPPRSSPSWPFVLPVVTIGNMRQVTRGTRFGTRCNQGANDRGRVVRLPSALVERAEALQASCSAFAGLTPAMVVRLALGMGLDALERDGGAAAAPASGKRRTDPLEAGRVAATAARDKRLAELAQG